jgi:NADPH-dependent glutamate synthase beta subunit-like oxidoreductase
MKCRARDSGGPISVKNLKRFLTDYELSSGESPKVTPFPREYEQKVAIIGSGPAGLTAGYYLAREGYEVDIFEELPVAGGMLAVGIPDYRLPKKYLQMEIDAIQQAGVNIKTSSPVENINALFNDGYKAVLIAVGAHKNRKLGIPGEDTDGVIDPIMFLRKVNLGLEVPSLGDRVGIVGGGNTAVDVARIALRLGAKNVSILYRRTRGEMPAIEEEIEFALEEGIRIEFLVAPTKAISEDGKLKGVELIRMKLGEPDDSGRRRPVPIEGTEFMLELDSLIPAISQEPEVSFVPEAFGIQISKWNTVVADKETYVTTKKGVFACGDAVTGPADVTTVMASAKIASGSIHKYLRGEELTREYKPVIPSVSVEPIAIEEEMEEVSRLEMPKLSAEQRRKNFDEVECGFSKEMAIQEARRCLRCDWEVQKLRKQKEEEIRKAHKIDKTKQQVAESI